MICVYAPPQQLPASPYGTGDAYGASIQKIDDVNIVRSIPNWISPHILMFALIPRIELYRVKVSFRSGTIDARKGGCTKPLSREINGRIRPPPIFRYCPIHMLILNWGSGLDFRLFDYRFPLCFS